MSAYIAKLRRMVRMNQQRAAPTPTPPPSNEQPTDTTSGTPGELHSVCNNDSGSCSTILSDEPTRQDTSVSLAVAVVEPCRGVVTAERVDRPVSQAVNDGDPRSQFEELIEERFGFIKRKLKPKQWIAVKELVWFIGEQGQNRQIIAPTGTGKTYVCFATLRMLADLYPDKFSPFASGHTPAIVIQPPKAIAQTLQVASDFGVLVNVVSLAALRASLGDLHIEWRTVMVNLQPVLYPFWKKETSPVAIWIDESQQVKNDDSTQSVIIESAALAGIPCIFASATPYSRICQAKVIACALRPRVKIGPTTVELSPKFWPAFSSSCCPSGYAPTDWTPKGLATLQKHLEPYTTRFAEPYPFPIRVRTMWCSFATSAERERYMTAFDEWQRIRVQVMNKNPLFDRIAELVAMNKFNQIAEEIRQPHVAREIARLIAKHPDRSYVLGFAYATALDICKEELVKLGLEHQIAEIRGGRNCDRDIDLFKRDKRRIALVTIAAGGAALSLDHNRYNRHKRDMGMSAVWNDIQLAQFMGRCQRIETQSAVTAFVFCYKGTEEQRKWDKVKRKLRSLAEVVTRADHHGEDGERGFVESIDEITEVRSTGGQLTLSDVEEEQLANSVVGTAGALTIDLEDDTDEP